MKCLAIIFVFYFLMLSGVAPTSTYAAPGGALEVSGQLQGGSGDVGHIEVGDVKGTEAAQESSSPPPQSAISKAFQDRLSLEDPASPLRACRKIRKSFLILY